MLFIRCNIATHCVYAFSFIYRYFIDTYVANQPNAPYLIARCIRFQWLLLFAWFNFNPSMDKRVEIIYPFLNFNGSTVEV